MRDFTIPFNVEMLVVIFHKFHFNQWAGFMCASAQLPRILSSHGVLSVAQIHAVLFSVVDWQLEPSGHNRRVSLSNVTKMVSIACGLVCKEVSWRLGFMPSEMAAIDVFRGAIRAEN